jgi:hypothetical protein
MLEYPTLLLLPWASSRRLILDAASDTPVGFVWVRPPGWGRWLSRQGQLGRIWEIHETEDEPLLCTLQRSWWSARRWVVADADGHEIGRLQRRGSLSATPSGAFVAVTEVGVPVDHGIQIQDRLGQVWVLRPDQSSPLQSLPPHLGTLRRCEKGWHLAFAGSWETDPFTKMLFLAAGVLLTTP